MSSQTFRHYPKMEKGVMRFFCLLLFVAMAVVSIGAVDLSKDGVSITVEPSPERVDVARDFEVTVTAVAPAGTTLAMPDLRDRFGGFSVAEDFAEEPLAGADGSTTYVSRWRLVPKPCEKVYRLAPFVVTVLRDGTPSGSFYTAPVYFESPAAREAVTGGIEVDPKKDLPPLSWRLVRILAYILFAVAAVVAAVWWTVRKIRQKIKEHRMSPIERAMLELDRLLKKGLPGRGRYKDFYVELTMVVRRYVQRQHNVRAPNLTTEEFFDVTRNAPTFPKSTLDLLIDFLRKADMVKFAGVEATPEIAAEAADSARSYVVKDDEIVKKKISDSKRISEIISSRSKK